eukprot:gene10862-14579_t
MIIAFLLFFSCYFRSGNCLSIGTASSLTFSSSNEYITYLKSQSTIPQGFSIATSRFSFKPYEVDKILPMNLTMIVLDKPTNSFTACFTSNKFPGGPVRVGKTRIEQSKYLQAVVINNKISNVCPGGGVSDGGYDDSDQVCQSVADSLNLPSKSYVFPSSTGIIGWRLPVQSIKNEIPITLTNLQSNSILPAALGICTTDRYPKLRSISNPKWSIIGIAKGAGMIEPNMATMLSYILTDLDLPKEKLSSILKKVVSSTFNSISVDSDQSTSDTVLILSSQKIKPDPLANDELLFEESLKTICTQLSEDIVRNGEGTQHVIKVKVTGAPSDLIARDIGKCIVNSPLVKCAISGCDPNVGRIVGAIGSYLGTLPSAIGDELSSSLSLKLGGSEIFSKNTFKLDPKMEKILSDYMLDCQLYPNELPEHDRNYPPHFKCVEIEVIFDVKNDMKWIGNSIVIGSDLTKEYVEVNADYRS